MNKAVEIIKTTRAYLLEITKDLTIEQLNIVPEGFNNNIIWNLGHLVAAQQGVCYRRAGLAMKVTDDYFDTYRPESKPRRSINADELSEIRTLFFSTLDDLETDYNNNAFANYPAWTTRYGVNITNIDEAINFLPFHEGLHLGYVMALKRVITK